MEAWEFEENYRGHRIDVVHNAENQWLSTFFDKRQTNFDSATHFSGSTRREVVEKAKAAIDKRAAPDT